VLKDLAKSHQGVGEKSAKKALASMPSKDAMQLSFFQLNDPVLEQIHSALVEIDINVLTPVEALMKLNEVKKLIGG